MLVYIVGLHLLHPVWHMSSLTQSKLIHLRREHLSFTFLRSVSNTDLHLKTKKICGIPNRSHYYSLHHNASSRSTYNFVPFYTDFHLLQCNVWCLVCFDPPSFRVLSLQLLDRCSGQRHIPTHGSALLGTKPPGQHPHQRQLQQPRHSCHRWLPPACHR